MKVSASLVIDDTDEYRIGFDTIESGFLSDELFEVLRKENIEIVEVILDRVKGITSTGISVLSKISEIIYRLFDNNDNIILYFFCDDVSEIPSSNKDLAPQAYRSLIFSAMFERFIRKHHINNVSNISVCITAIDRSEYLHFIVRNHHRKYVEYIQKDVEQIYSK